MSAEVPGVRTRIRALLHAQRPDLAHLPLGEVLTGWDNHMVRLGEDLVVRLPRREIAVELLARELTWLPRIAADTGVPVAAPAHRLSWLLVDDGRGWVGEVRYSIRYEWGVGNHVGFVSADRLRPRPEPAP